MFNPMTLEGKRILVTGASSGIGKEIAGFCSKLGAKLILVARSEERLKEVLEGLEGEGHQYICSDLSEIEKIGEIFQKITTFSQEKLSGLVHAAGISLSLPLSMLTKTRIDQVMLINFYAFVELIRQFSNKKYSSCGSIVGISSVASQNGESCQTAYSASKAAMDGTIKPLSYELAKKDIRINSILPGMVWTDALQKLENEIGKEQFNMLTSKQILGVGNTQDVASMAAFLLSNASKFITGRSFYVDGGRF